MITTTSPLAVARTVRLLAMSAAVGVMSAVGALQPFSASSVDVEPAVPQPTPRVAAAVEQAVGEQEALGLTCQDEPRLTNVVLFQFSRTDAVVVLTFDEALRETAARTGWVRGYCI